MRATEQTSHRPYPPPSTPWALHMRWHDLLFMHWPIRPDSLRPLIPDALSLDTFDGSAWLGVVPFRMSGVRPRLLPAVERVSAFPELNLRTYVTAGGKPGVWFFSLDAANPLAVRIARATFGLPYFDAEMSCRREGEWVRYRSTRTHRGTPEAKFSGSHRPVGETISSPPGSVEHFLTARYCLYSADRKGRVRRGEIQHADWPLRPAEAEVDLNTMTDQIGVRLPNTEPLLHFSDELEVFAHLPHYIKT